MTSSSGIRSFAGSTASEVSRSAETIASAVYQVTLLPSGELFGCPAETAVLDAAHAADILIPYSCRGGRCGSCRSRLLEGEVEYRAGLPEALDAADSARGIALLCCAFPRSDLIIELAPAGFGDDEFHASA